MKPLVCELCSSNEIVKQDGMYVCQHCGTKYTVEEAKKLMVEGTVKIDNTDELKNLYQIARRAKDDDNGENAAKYYDMILVKDPTSWEASFYVVYFKAMQCKIAHIRSAAISVNNCVGSVLKLIKENVSDKDEQIAAYQEVTTRVLIISTMLFNGAKNHYEGIDYQIKHKYTQEYVSNACAAFKTMYYLGDCLDMLFKDDKEANLLSVSAWKSGINLHAQIVSLMQDKVGHKRDIDSYAEKIKKYDSSYVAPTVNTSSGGCYVATAVYGSYDCPEVWTLRRFRDNILAKNFFGRLFIMLYYAISPTLVKWFGKSEWFKNMWKPILDEKVKKLNLNGVENTPYNDRQW